MNKQLMMYETLVPLNSAKHNDVYVKRDDNFNYAKNMGSIPITATEFSHAANEYAIVFAGIGQDILPVVISSVIQGENIYVNQANKWKARYVPAFVRRYPFVFSYSEDKSRLIMCIDESYVGVNREGRGERLFDSDGEQTQFLKNTLAFLENYQSHFKYTQLFCQKLVELDLLEDMVATVNVGGVGLKKINGFKGINRAKLKALSATSLFELHKNDWLELIHIHLMSLQNFAAAMEKVTSPEVGEKSNLKESVQEETVDEV